jgi:hypothetical protein
VQGNPTPAPLGVNEARNPVAEQRLIQGTGVALRQPTKDGRQRAMKALSASAAAAGIPPERIQAVIDSVGNTMLVGH